MSCYAPEEQKAWSDAQIAEINVSIDKMVRAGSNSVEAYSAIVSAAANLIALADLELGAHVSQRLNEFIRSVENNRAIIRNKREGRLDA